ncbi:MAG: Gfo/Idh/MocA family protein [Anaerolineae bacterium]
MTSQQTLKWGLLSTANINRALIGPIRDADRSELVGVASRRLDRARAYAQEWEISKAYGSYEDMLGDPEIDVVYISLPNALHEKWTVKAAEAGKHVLCEKPIVPTVAALDLVAAAAKANDVTVFEAFMYLHHPQALKVAEMIADGRLGQVQLINSWFSFYLPPENSDNIRLSKDLAGGATWDVGVYPNSMSLTMAQAAGAGDLPLEVWAQQIVGETGVDVTMIAQMKFAKDLTAQIVAGFRMPFRVGTIIVGDEGTITIPQPWKPGMDYAESEILFATRQGDEERIAIEGIDPYLCEVQAMEACVLDGADPVVPLSRSRDFLRSVLAIYESARTGQPAAL